MSNIVRIHNMTDPHVHLRDLDWSHKATFESETAAAIAGGYTTVLDMPNTAPTATTPENLARKLARLQESALCDWGVFFGASQDDNTHHYAAVEAQTCGLKMFNNDTTGDLLLSDQASRAKHMAAWHYNRPIAVHAEEETVGEILDLVRQFGRWTHFCHISTRYEIDLLRAAKNEGLPISVGVTPHHLYLTEDDARTLGGFGLMKPTLKRATDRDALWEGIADGTVDVVESDHAPHSLDEKLSDTPPYGVPGLETTLGLMGLALAEKRISIERLIALIATNPRIIWNLATVPDTYTVVDFSAAYQIDRANLRGACKWSPFEGMTLYGLVHEVWLRGKQIFDGENILAQAGEGRNVAESMIV